MKERFLKVLKWFFIVLGVIFFIQIIIVLLIAVGLALPFRYDFGAKNNFSSSEKTFKHIQPVINFAEDYYKENNKYPDKIDENIKIKDLYEYEYKTSKDNNCYTVTLKPVQRQTLLPEKNNEKIRQYQHCQANSENSSSSSESYLEFSK